MNAHKTLWLGALALALISCKNTPSSSKTDTPDVAAWVNGVPITEADILLRMEADNHEVAPTGHKRKAALDSLILKEVLAQKAASEGLNQDPKYKETWQRMAAQMAAFRRQELSDRLLAREAERKNVPSEDAQRAYFAKHRERIARKPHVLMILRRSEAAIVEVRSLIDRGKPFEEVAAGLFPGLPEGQKPWDLGFLQFHKVPEPWRETLDDLKPGEMSGILKGPNSRFWLIKLVGVKNDENVTFESMKDAVIADMAVHGAEDVREKVEADLLAAAKVEVVTP